jgi:hypothetical protein
MTLITDLERAICKLI